MASVFTRIVQREIPAYIIAETDDFMAFLDAFPLKRGHVLCIPKQETDHLFDLDPALYNGLMEFSYKVAAALKKSIPCNRIGVVVAGFEVPHAHVHLIPVNTMKEMDFNNPKLQVSKEEMQAIAEVVKSNL